MPVQRAAIKFESTALDEKRPMRFTDPYREHRSLNVKGKLP
jgi:hypothetical protein